MLIINTTKFKTTIDDLIIEVDKLIQAAQIMLIQPHNLIKARGWLKMIKHLERIPNDTYTYKAYPEIMKTTPKSDQLIQAAFLKEKIVELQLKVNQTNLTLSDARKTPMFMTFLNKFNDNLLGQVFELDFITESCGINKLGNENIN